MNKRPAPQSADLETDYSNQIWAITCKLHGMGELIKFYSGDSSPPNQTECSFGIGEIITNLANELDEIREVLDERERKRSLEQLEKSKKPGRKVR